MSQYRFILDCDLDEKEIEITEPRVVNQLGKVLRAKIEDEILWPSCSLASRTAAFLS